MRYAHSIVPAYLPCMKGVSSMRFTRSSSRALFLSLILSALLVTAFSGRVPAQTAPDEHEKTLTKMFDDLAAMFLKDGRVSGFIVR